MKRYVIQLLFLFVALISRAGSGSNDTVSHKLIVPANQISIMTYNIKMLPRGATFLHHHPVKRARLIPAKLLNESPDVIVFEEAFDGKAIRAIKRKLKSQYPYIAGADNRKVVTYKRAGGVLMFSKYPLKELESIRYSECKGIDCAGNKGAMLVEVDHPVHKFQLLGTHMQAGGSQELKISQYHEAADLLKRHEQEGIPQFAAGDFNTHKNDSVLYPQLISALKAQDGDISSELKFTTDHLLNDMDAKKRDKKKRSVIDYVFVKENGVKIKSQERDVREFEQRWSHDHKDLSDHNALLLKVTL